jgi:branched-chain amino acid transport system substrate-binding protein
MIRPFQISCADHQGASISRVQQWDGKTWKVVSDWIQADDSLIAPMVKAAAQKYAADKGISPSDCSKTQ